MRGIRYICVPIHGCLHLLHTRTQDRHTHTHTGTARGLPRRPVLEGGVKILLEVCLLSKIEWGHSSETVSVPLSDITHSEAQYYP